ncbi:MAG: MarR family transcriptional regulator [Lentisphaeria bacterium]|nr:MarR family transcriptional regulator [Lentisphaeria bacterium]
MANSDPAILRKSVSRLYDAFRESVDSIGNVSSIDVSIRQHQTMSLVCRLTEEKPNGVTLKELAEAMKLAPATVSELVESLVKKDFLQRVQNPEDRRAVQITLTPHGQTLLDESIKRVEGLCEKLLNGLSTSERTSMLGALAKITSRL